MLDQNTYVSSDELGRSEAFAYGYRTICQHPREVRDLVAGQRLVIAIDYILFDDKDEAIALALAAAEQGLWVGIHTLHPEAACLAPVFGKPNVVVAKTHRKVRSSLRQKSRKQGASDVHRHHVTSKKETIHVHVKPTEAAPGS